MTATYLQPSFVGGEWSKFAHGRADHPNYRKSMSRCVNGYPMAAGAWVRRPGTMLASLTRGGAAAALIPFSFEDNQPYTVELTEGFLRFYQGTSLIGGEAALISDISTATPAIVTLPEVHGLSDDAQVMIAASDPASAALLYRLTSRPFRVTAPSTTTLALYDAVTGAPIDGSTAGWTGSTTATISQISEVVSPYTEEQVVDVRNVQNETDMVLLHEDVFPQVLTATPPGTGVATFSIEPADFVDGPYLDPVEIVTLTPTGVNGLINLTLLAPLYDSARAYAEGDYVTSSSITYVSLQDQNVNHTPASSATYWEVSNAGAAINGGAGFTEADFGRHIRLFSEPLDWVAATTYAAKEAVKFDSQYWVALTAIAGDAESANEISITRPGVDATKWALLPSAARWTWGKIVDFPSSGLIAQDLAGSEIIGNFDVGEGVVAFDGDLSEPVGSGTAGRSEDLIEDDPSYLGKSFTSGFAISSAIVYPSSNDGLNLNGGSTGSLRLRAKNGVPADHDDGVLLGSTSFNASSQNSPITITSNDQTTTYTHVWIDFRDLPWKYNGAFNTYPTRTVSVSEIEFYNASAPAGSEVTVQILGDPLLYTTAIRTWRLGLFNLRDAAYPTNGCYHEGRLWLAGAVQNRFDCSRSNEFLNFSPTEADGSVPNNAAISYTFNADDLNRINWMVPDLQGIVAGTFGGEWLIDSPSTAIAGFAPTNIRARRVTKYKCAAVEPKRTGLTTVFVQRYKRQVHEFLADAYSGKFVGPELTELNREVSESGIEQLVYQQGLVPIIWMRKLDGSLAGATYRRTSMISTQPPELIGWHRHDLGSERSVTNISTGPSADGTLDTLMVVAKDDETGLHYVEVLANVFDENDELLSSAPALDSAIRPTTGAIVSTNLRLYGLWPLNGQEVAVWVGGLDCGDLTVTDGYVDVPLDSAGGLFTNRFLTQTASGEPDFGDLGVTLTDGRMVPVMVGYSFTSQGQLLRPLAQDQTGSQTGPALAKIRRTPKLQVLLHQAQGLSFGTSFTALRAALFETVGGRRYTPTELFSGVFDINVDDGYSYDSQLCWEISRPYPAALLAVGAPLTTEN